MPAGVPADLAKGEPSGLPADGGAALALADVLADGWADARLAALLLAIHPQGLGGARLRGPADERRDHWLSLLRCACPAEAPWQRLPLNADDDRLLGGLDLGATLQRGTVVTQPGLLERCHGGVLLAAMAERMSPALAARLVATMDTGRVVPQRLAGAAPPVAGPGSTSAASVHAPSGKAAAAKRSTRTSTTAGKPAGLALITVLALDEGQADGEETPPPALLDRLGLHIDLTRLPRPAPGGVVDPSAWAAEAAAARQRLPGVRCADNLVQALCEAALALGVDGMRASQQALAAARAHAAWCGRSDVTVEDAALAARVVLAPRATRVPVQPVAADETQTPPPAEEPPETQQQPEQPPPEPPAPPPEAASPERPESPPDALPDDASIDAASQDQVLQAALAAIPPGLLALLASAVGRGPSGAGGRAGALQASRLRGRPYGSRRGDPRSGARLHLIDTLRAAAPWQLLRRRERDAASGGLALPAVARATPGATPASPVVLVRREDFHISRFRQRRETTTLFVVDASGSAALHRLAEAKGAVELLLADCYVRRDRVALLSFRGSVGAELLLPPTRSLVRAKRCLAAMPGGGGTPLAAALDAARELAQNLARQGGTPLVVVLTDGRANIARDGSPGRDRAQADALVSAKLWQGSGLGVLWLDTAQQPQQQAQVLALTMGARYLPLPHADAGQMSKAVLALR